MASFAVLGHTGVTTVWYPHEHRPTTVFCYGCSNYRINFKAFNYVPTSSWPCIRPCKQDLKSIEKCCRLIKKYCMLYVVHVLFNYQMVKFTNSLWYGLYKTWGSTCLPKSRSQFLVEHGFGTKCSGEPFLFKQI